MCHHVSAAALQRCSTLYPFSNSGGVIKALIISTICVISGNPICSGRNLFPVVSFTVGFPLKIQVQDHNGKSAVEPGNNQTQSPIAGTKRYIPLEAPNKIARCTF